MRLKGIKLLKLEGPYRYRKVNSKTRQVFNEKYLLIEAKGDEDESCQ